MLRYRRELAVLLAWGALLGLLAVWAPTFFAGDQLRNMLVSAAPVIVAAVGMTLVMLTRQIDISIGSIFSLCGVVAGLLVQAGWPMPLAATISVLCGLLLGLVNGALVAGLRLPAIVVTLSTLVAVRELLRYFREGEFVRNLPAGFQWFGLSQAAGQWVVVASALVIALGAGWGLSCLGGGRAIYATGSDPEAARLVGIRPRRVVLGVFAASGTLAALAALLNDIRFADVDPNAGNGLEMQAIAAVVVGGASVNGGRGTIAGTVLGVLLLSTIGPALVFLHVQPQWERAIQGTVILAAVSFAGHAVLNRRSRGLTTASGGVGTPGQSNSPSSASKSTKPA
ncbi:MAG: ABC transporter permease [Planctomycetes bacterium]|nr:ABC transporter permease [Planctomycetota bacterium]